MNFLSIDCLMSIMQDGDTKVHMISFQDCDPILSWKGLSKALKSGHKLSRQKYPIHYYIVVMILCSQDQLGLMA